MLRPLALLAEIPDLTRSAFPREDDHGGKRQWHRSEFPSADDPGWARCTVKSHEDFPRHIYRLMMLLLCIQFRWLLTRGKLARTLVTPSELAIDDAKEAVWMDMYDHDRDTLEDILISDFKISGPRSLIP